MDSKQIRLLQQLAVNLRQSAEIVDQLLILSGHEVPIGPPEATLTPQVIDALVVKHGTVREVSRILGVSAPTLHTRLNVAFGKPDGDSAAAGALLRRLIVRLGIETVVEEFGSSREIVEVWAQRHLIPASGRRAIARVAEKYGIRMDATLPRASANGCGVARPR